MKSLKHASLGLVAAALLFSAPAFAASIPTPATPKPSVSDSLKAKAAETVEQAKDKADAAADKLQDALGGKQDKAAKASTEVLDVKQESLTVETPKGVEQETVTPSPPKPPRFRAASPNRRALSVGRRPEAEGPPAGRPFFVCKHAAATAEPPQACPWRGVPKPSPSPPTRKTRTT